MRTKSRYRSSHRKSSSRVQTAQPETQPLEPGSIRRAKGAAEVLILAMACLGAWAFGAAEAWAELGLYAGVVAVTVLTVYADRRPDWRSRLTSLPSLALAGLVMLALVQATPLPRWLMRGVSPAAAARVVRLAPAVPERIVGDTNPVVALPAATLSLDPEASRLTAARLAAAWLLFQAVCALGGSEATLRRFGTAMLVNAAALALFSIVQTVGWNGKLYWLRDSIGGAGPFVCHNHLAAYLNLGLGFGLAALLVRGRRSRSESPVQCLIYWPLYATGLIVAALLISLSRGGLMAMLGALVGGAIFFRPRKWSSLSGSLVGIAVLTLTMLAVSGSSQSFQTRAWTILEKDSYLNRVGIWAWAGVVRAGAPSHWPARIRAWRITTTVKSWVVFMRDISFCKTAMGRCPGVRYWFFQ